MKYHAPTEEFTISIDDLKLAAHDLRWAIQKIRAVAKLDLKGYSNDEPMDDPQFAETAILDAARHIGIDLGDNRYGKLDVSDAG